MKRHIKFGGIVVARMNSTRLPNKALKEVNGIPLIEYVIKRASIINNIDKIIVATTDKSSDDPLYDYCIKNNVNVFRGNLDDVALRVLNCAQKYDLDYFVRINGDSPFLDPVLIQRGIEMCKNYEVDFVTNLVNRTFPYGISVEIVKTSVFEQCYKKMSTEFEREHVTQYLYKNIDKYKIKKVISENSDVNRARLVVDTSEDFEKFEKICDYLGEKVHTADYREVSAAYLKLFYNQND